jgi:hypothetical protein
MQPLHQDRWRVEKGVERGGILGTRIVEWFSVPSTFDGAAVGVVLGATMPVAIGDIGEGIRATISEIVRAPSAAIPDTIGTSTWCLEIIGFESTVWEGPAL